MRAAKTTGGWQLDGSKRFITNAPNADLITVLARTSGIAGDRAGLSMFLVDGNSGGLSLGPIYRKLGHKGSPVADMFFDKCFVPDANVLGKIGRGLGLALMVVARGRLRVSAVSVAIAERLIMDGIKYAKNRIQFGQPISNFQLVQGMLADSETEAFAARSMVLSAAQTADNGGDIKCLSACSKYFCTEMVGRVADRILQIYGGYGYMHDCSIEALFRDVRLFRIYEGTSEIQQLIIAKDMLNS